MIDKSWVWEGEVQTNNIENIICCFFFFFPCLPLHLSWFLIHWHGLSASQLPASRVLWGLLVLGERNTGISPHHLPTGFRVWNFLLSLTLISWTWIFFHLSQILIKFITVFPLLLSRCLRNTHHERQQWRHDIRSSSLWLLIAQAARVLMTGETLEDTLLFVYLFPTQLQSDGGAASQLIRRPYSASQTASPFCQFRKWETFSLVLFPTIWTTRGQFGSNRR